MLEVVCVLRWEEFIWPRVDADGSGGLFALAWGPEGCWVARNDAKIFCEWRAQTLTAAEARAERKAALLKKAVEEEKRNSDIWASVRKLVKSPAFQASAESPLQSLSAMVITGHDRGDISRVGGLCCPYAKQSKQVYLSHMTFL
jgi:hypothetical protein